ncbi:MAG: ankyrin repeat domain-containing protein [Candidatus Amoebophilus sp.]
MYRKYNLNQQLVICILLISLFLQSCGNSFNSPLPNSTKKGNTKQLVHQVDISPILDQEFRAEGGHLVTFYEDKGTLLASIEVANEKYKAFNGVPVYIEKGAELASLPYLPKIIQQRRIQVEFSEKKKPIKIAIHQPWLRGGMQAGNEEVSSEILSEVLWETILPYLSNQELYATSRVNHFFSQLTSDVLKQRRPVKTENNIGNKNIKEKNLVNSRKNKGEKKKKSKKAQNRRPLTNFLPNNLNIKKDRWLNDYNKFISGDINDLRQNRRIIDRPIPSFSLAIEILEFIEEAKKNYGTDILLESDELFNLIIDMCDVVNAQHPDFKKRYEIFIEQSDENNDQLPFSLFSFDRVAQSFHYRKELFDNTKNSAYISMIKEIIDHEFPLLKRIFSLIFNLNKKYYEDLLKYNDEIPLIKPTFSLLYNLDEVYHDQLADHSLPVDQSFLDRIYHIQNLTDTNLRLDQLVSATKTKASKIKPSLRKEIEKSIDRPKLNKLHAITSMAHDYLTLGRLTKAIEVILSIDNFKNRKELKEASEKVKAELEKSKKELKKARDTLEKAKKKIEKECLELADRINLTKEKEKEILQSNTSKGELARIKKELERLEEALKIKDPLLNPNNPAREAFNKLVKTTKQYEQAKKNKKTVQKDFEKFKEPQEAFLAMVVQIGELATNKNISKFVREYMPTIPLDYLVDLRDAIIHQDEKGSDYFSDLIDGTNTAIDFKAWQEEMEILNRKIADTKEKIWGNNPKALFENWINKILIRKPIQHKIQLTPIVRNNFEKTLLYKQNKILWALLVSEKKGMSYDHFVMLNNAYTVSFNIKEWQTYNKVEIYLWNCLKQRAIHLNDNEKDILVRVAKRSSNNPTISKMCFALLKRDLAYLTADNWEIFIKESKKVLLDYEYTVTLIYLKFRGIILKKNLEKYSLYKKNTVLWSYLLTKSGELMPEYFRTLRNAYNASFDSSEQKTYMQVYDYFWDCLKQRAIHLTEDEKATLIEIARHYFDYPYILKTCFALFKKEQSYLTSDNVRELIRSCLEAKLDFLTTIHPILLRLRLAMPITVQVYKEFLYHIPSKLNQNDRKKLAEAMFKRTSAHLHNLTHNDNFTKIYSDQATNNTYEYYFQKNLRNPNPIIRNKFLKTQKQKEELLKTPSYTYQDDYGNICLNSKGFKKWTRICRKNGIEAMMLKNLGEIWEPEDTDEWKEFHKKEMNEVFRKYHKVHLPEAIKKNPVIYLASVYSISVWFGSLKSWVEKQEEKGIIPSNEIKQTVEKLRYGRNFIAHGDLFRDMSNINLACIQQYLLSNHLDHSTTLNFSNDEAYNLHTKDKEVNTALHWAVFRGDLEGVRHLLTRITNVNVKNKYGYTALHIAAYKGYEDIATLLIEQIMYKRTNIDVVDNEGNTPLHWAAQNGNIKIVALLLAKGAYVNATDNEGNTSLHVAAKFGHKNIASLLLGRQADVNAKDKNGLSPVHFAIQNGHSDLLELLIQRGAY